jgi:ABC-type glycerol-3-phosphate transport system substrate-binding protein
MIIPADTERGSSLISQQTLTLRPKPKRTTWATSALLATALLGATAAFADGTAVAAKVVPASNAAEAPITLSWQMWAASPAEIAAWDHDASIVHSEFPWITVKLTYDQPFGNYFTKFPTEIASNTEPDLVAIQSLRATGFQAGFLPLNTSELDSDGLAGFNLMDYNQGILNGLKNSSGQQIALPYDFGPLMVFYNKTEFMKYKVPLPTIGWTWSQFNADAALMTKDSGGNVYGYIENPYLDEFLAYATDHGVSYLKDGKLDIDTPALARLLASYVSAVKANESPLPPSNAPETNWDVQQWEDGVGAMYIDGPWDLINDIASVKAGIENFKIGIAPLPVGPNGKSVSILAGSGFGISPDLYKNHSGVAKAVLLSDAIKAIEGLTSPAAEQFLSSEGRAFSGRTAQQKYWFATVEAQGVNNATTEMDAALQSSVAYVTTNKWNGTTDAFNSEVVGVMQGSITPQAALAYVQANQGTPAA